MGCRLRCDGAGGLDLDLPGGITLRSIAPAVRACGRWRALRAASEPAGRELTGEAGELGGPRLGRLHWRRVADGLVLAWQPVRALREAGGFTVASVRGLRPRRVYAEPAHTALVPHWGAVCGRASAPDPFDRRRRRPGRASAYGPLVLAGEDGRCVLFGPVTARVHPAYVHLERFGRPPIVLGCGDGTAGVHRTERFCVLGGRDPWTLLGRWAQLVAACAGGPPPLPSPAPEGWDGVAACRGGCDDAVALWNLPRIEKLNWGAAWRQGGPLVVLERERDALLSPSAHETFADRARRIREHHGRAALRFAPLLTRDRRHRALLRDERGRPVTIWRGPVRHAVLDPAAPECVEPLVDAIARLRERGCEAFVLSWLFVALLRGRRHGGCPGAQAYRALCARLREAAGGALLIGEHAPLLASAGRFDLLRVGPEPAPIWRARLRRWLGWPWVREARASLEAAALRSWGQRRGWVADPGPVLLRSRASRLTATQVRTLGSFASVHAGAFWLSDRAEHLPPEREKWMREWLPVAPEPMRLAEAHARRLVLERTVRNDAVCARLRWLYNRGDRPLRLRLPAVPDGWLRVRRSAWPFQDERPGGLRTIELPPGGHDVIADVELRDDLTFCGDWGRADLGFDQLREIRWDEAAGIAVVRLALSRVAVHRFYLRKPEGTALVGGRVSGGVPPVSRERFVGVVITGGGEARIELRFAPASEAAPEPPIPADVLASQPA
ncbi:MAG: hypothetical protein D6776_10910 [Planctomycetota bacterium]|nr:MAG: hypothetical protein D6776_10910 [Planctomycetota bacterium]